jgi:hypothetical protein
VWFYVERQSWLSGEWDTVCGFAKYEDAEKFILNMLDKNPGTFGIRKVYNRES